MTDAEIIDNLVRRYGEERRHIITNIVAWVADNDHKWPHPYITREMRANAILWKTF